MSYSCLTTAEILGLFQDEITTRGGDVTETFDNGSHLLARSVLPQVAEVCPGDAMQGGVALKATPDKVRVYPYLFREVCRNGAILSESLRSQQVELSDDLTLALAETTLREAVAACCQPEVFAENIRDVQTLRQIEIDLPLMLLPFLSQLPPQEIGQILSKFFEEDDRTAYGALNAVTAVARETPEPRRRWQLEELGGGVIARLKPRRPIDSRGISVHRDESITVG